MQGTYALREMQQIWKESDGATLNARGALGGICTIWNTTVFREEHRLESTHWVLVHLKNLPPGIIYPIFNVYMPNNYWEKIECWESLMKIKETGIHNNFIIVGDFNTTLNQGGKKGGSIVRDLFGEHMEDLISELDPFDVQPSKGKHTWSNKRLGVGHIATRLDRFLIHSSLLLLPLNISSKIIPWGISDHHPIALSFDKA